MKRSVSLPEFSGKIETFFNLVLCSGETNPPQKGFAGYPLFLGRSLSDPPSCRLATLLTNATLSWHPNAMVFLAHKGCDCEGLAHSGAYVQNCKEYAKDTGSTMEAIAIRLEAIVTIGFVGELGQPGFHTSGQHQPSHHLQAADVLLRTWLYKQTASWECIAFSHRIQTLRHFPRKAGWIGLLMQRWRRTRSRSLSSSLIDFVSTEHRF